MTLRDNIDTNKNNRIDVNSQYNEINNFILDKNKGEENLNKLGNHLNNLDAWKLDNLGIKDAIQSYFGTPERSELNKKISGKINKNEPLTNKELSLLYLEMITNKNSKLTEEKLKFDSKQPIEKICGGALISYIINKYGNPIYTGKKVEINLPNQTQKKKSINPLDRIRENNQGKIILPDFKEIKENEADFYCKKLVSRAEQNFPNEIDKAKRQLQIKHKYKDKSVEQAYIKYDTLLIAFNKYCEIVSKNHTKLITSPEIGYKDDEDFKRQMNQIEYFESEISRRYPGIDKILEIVKKFHEEIEKNKKKFFGEDKDGVKLKKAENDYKHFNDFIQSKYKEYNIKKVEQSLKKTPNSGDETVEYFLNYNKITKFQNEINQKRLSYGDSIKKYTSYTENLKSIHDKYNLEQYEDTLSKYHYDVQRLSHGIDFAKFQKYTNKIKYETSLQNGMKNVSLLGNLLMDKTNKYFPFKEIRDAEIQKQVKQNETDKWRDDLKNNSPRIHWLLTGLSGLYNGLVDFTIGTSSSLGVLILGLIGGEDETLAQMDHKEEFDNRFKINISSSQTEEVYNSETGEFNFNLDNTTYTVASSISQMLGLIYGGGAIGKGATKAFQIGENVAGKIGLFSSSFITQIGGSYQEAVRGGLSGGEALGYSMLSATMQSGLELISPNEVLLGKGSGITKELIRNACKSGSKESIRMVGKIFTRNVWNEIREENIQEALQTVAGNLVNMATDGAFGSEIGADWSRKNFASTAVITTLTTGITTGTSTGRQMSQLNSSDRTKLIDYIKSDNGTYSDVIEMINDGITGTIKIPNVDIQQLQELKGLLTSSTGNTNTGNLNGGTINTEIIPDDVEVVAVDDDVEVVAVDDQNIEIGDPKEIRRVANIFSEFADFNVDEYVDSHANIPLYGRDEQYIRDVLGFLKEYTKNDKDKNDKTKLDPSCFSYFQNARVVDYILSNSKLKIENIKNLLQDEKINIKDIEYAIKQNDNLSENEIKEEIKKFNILLTIESEEDLQKYITGKKIGSDITGDLEQYINENGLSENSEKIENWYYGNFSPETQKFTMARDIGNSEFDIKLIQSIINKQNITPRGLEHNSPYTLLKELHDNNHESFRLYGEYLLGKNVTSLAGEYSVGSFGQDNGDPALYWHTRVGKDSFIGGAKYRIIGEFNPGEIIRSGELNQVADQTANWPESERVTIGEVPNNNVKQIIDLETGKVIYDRDSGFADLSLSENNQSKKANLEEKYSIDLPKEGENLPQILGSRFHEERRQSRLQSDGTYAPRVEKTSDQTWISEHNGQTEVDIANTPFEDLPSDWQSENLEAAKLALGLVYNKIKNGENITPEMIEEMSEIVHNKRLERNGIEGSFENQRVAYKQLSELEKEKDKNQILRAIKTVEQGNNDHFNGSSQQSEITKAETNETNDKNIELLQELGIEVNLYSIEVTKNLTEEEINTIRDINKLITIDVWGIQLIKESKLTKDNINTIEKLKNMGFEITIYDIERIKGLTKSDIINIGKLKNTGLEITIYDVEKIKGLTDNDINTIEKLKNMGFEISISSIEGIKGLTDSDISHIEKLKNMGFEIKTHKIEKIKGLTDSDISHIEKLKNIGISQLNLNDIEIIRSITENDINKIKKLYNILNNLGIKISIYNIERIKLMTDENVREFELKQDDIIKIKLLKNLGVEINIEDIENVRLLKQDDIDKIERINNLGIKINVLGGLYFLSIELINSLTEEDISKMEQLRFSELLPNEISQDDIEIIRSLTNDEITYLKSIKSDTKNIQDIISFKDYNIILNIAPIKDKRNYIKRKNEYLKNNETLSNEQFNALFKPNTDEYKFQQTQNEDFGTGKYGISDINQTDLGYCYAYTTFELLKKSNFFEVLVRTSMKETNNGREIKLPLGDPNGETIKVNKTEIDQEYLIGENRKVNINSNSALGIKILEIAFIKKSIIQNNYIHQLAKTNKLQPIILKAQEEFKETGDITITGELLEYLEAGITSDAMETIINNDLLSNLPITEKEKKIAIIKYINQGNIKIGISRDKDTGDFTVHPKIIENNKNKEKGPDLKYNILCRHAYSIERTYYDESINENLIVFVNPYNTSEKIHITVDECINLFPNRSITTFNIDKIFNQDGKVDITKNENNINSKDETNYFDGKSHKFEITETQARGNSEMMDNLLNEINENNKSEKLEELRKNISEQYKQVTGEELNLTDEQLLSILDAHEQDGVLGELSLGQLRQKVKILDETITDSKFRRFLLEAGFCGSWLFSFKKDSQNNIYQIKPERQIFNSNMNQQEITRFNKYLPSTLRNGGLIPNNKIEIGNGTILYTTNKIVGKDSKRPYIIGYTFDKYGTLELRQFYRSMSEGCWRACPGMREDGNLSKGEFLTDSSYETTTKVDLRLGNTFDNLQSTYYNDYGPYNGYFKFSPISYIASVYKKNYILENDMGPQNIYIRKLFPNLVGNDNTGHNKYNATDFYAGKYGHTIQNVIKGYNKLVPEGLDYKHMKINPSKSYSYHHDYLGNVNVQVCTIKRNGIDLDFHFSRATNSPGKVWIENVACSDAQLNSWGVYNKQINAGPLTAKPVDYDEQCPNGPEIDQVLPKIAPGYRDIRNLYQGNPIIKKFKKISR